MFLDGKMPVLAGSGKKPPTRVKIFRQKKARSLSIGCMHSAYLMSWLCTCGSCFLNHCCPADASDNIPVLRGAIQHADSYLQRSDY
eukprot:scaffold23486_cov72-Skeletonema_dohrnii-CCMP3373.AAC.1